MKTALLARLKLGFWSVYGRYVWNEHRAAAPQLAHLLALLHDHLSAAPAQILDLGCGTGTYALALAQRGFVVTGVDGAPGMLEQAYRKCAAAPAGHLRFRHLDLDHPFPLPARQFDGAIAISVLQALTDPAGTLREVWRVLKPQGVLVVLHAPRPAYRTGSLRDEVRQRAAQVQRTTVRTVALIAVKSWAERVGATRYWTEDELSRLLETQHYEAVGMESGPPIMAVARKPKDTLAPGAAGGA
jgi:ubiquinone/menaquinone biosynthesis C-methylase UbiE